MDDFYTIDPFDEEGYTLVESVVSLALLITVLLPLAHYTSIEFFQRRAKQEIVATMLAQKTIEEAIAAPGLIPTSKREGPWHINTVYQNQHEGLIVRVLVKRNGRIYSQLVALKPFNTLLNQNAHKRSLESPHELHSSLLAPTARIHHY